MRVYRVTICPVIVLYKWFSYYWLYSSWCQWHIVCSKNLYIRIRPKDTVYGWDRHFQENTAFPFSPCECNSISVLWCSLNIFIPVRNYMSRDEQHRKIKILYPSHRIQRWRRCCRSFSCSGYFLSKYIFLSLFWEHLHHNNIQTHELDYDRKLIFYHRELWMPMTAVWEAHLGSLWVFCW